MSIRLSKITKELNIGLSTAVEFLRKNKFTDVEANPNFKITDEQYDLLNKEFNKDKSIRIESDRLSQERHTKEKAREVVSIEGFNEPVKKEPEEIKIGLAEAQKPKFTTVGKINLDELNKKPAAKKEEKKKEEKPIVKEEKEVVKETPKKPEVEKPVEQPKKKKLLFPKKT